MLSILHVTTGAFIASKVTTPWLAFPLAIASHYLADWIPHWDVGTGLSMGKRSRSQAIIWGVLDLLLGYGIVFLLHRFFMPESVSLWWLLLGGTVAIIPDLIEAPSNFLSLKLPLIEPLNQFHERLHHSVYSMFTGLVPQIIVLLVIFFLSGQ